MKKFFIRAGIVSALALSFQLAAAENAQSVYELERSKAMDPAKFQMRGDTPGSKYNYKVGDEVPFTLRFDCGQPGNVKGWTIAVERFGEDGVRETAVFPAENGRSVVFKTRGKAPGFVIVRASVLDEKGKPVLIPNWSGKVPLRYTGGIGFEVEKAVIDPYPEDFDAYWDKIVQEVNAYKGKVKLTPVPTNNKAVRLYIYQVGCAPDMETTGYISIPVKPGKYPGAVMFYGYGAVCSAPMPPLDPKTITMTVSRFGIMPGKDKAFYAEAAKKIGRYCFVNNDSRETCYCKGMIVRDLAALKFLKSRREWDGKNLKVYGASMGGLQSIWMAGLDRDVTVAEPGCPWFCFLRAPVVKSTFWPSFRPALLYFDAVNFCHRIPKSCKVHFSTGIGDYCCPVSGVFRAYRSVPGNKSITLIQGPTHAPCHKNPQLFEITGDPLPAK